MQFPHFQFRTQLLFFLLYQVLCHSQSTSGSGHSTLRQVHVIFRHGARTPIGPITYPLDPYNDPIFWPQGWGQLTNDGQRSQYELGRYLRYRYDGFLSRQYQEGQVLVTTSDLDRTITSALANLAGLYPPQEPQELWKLDLRWQPIPIRTLHPKVDNKLNFMPNNCPKYKLRLEQLLDASFVKEINVQFKDLYNNLTLHTGRTVKDFIDVAEIYDTLLVEKQNGMALPTWTKKLFPKKMELLAVLPFDLISFTEEMTRLRAGPLLYEILHRMEVEAGLVKIPATQKQTFRKAKLYLNSGHDTTVTALLSGLGIYDRRHIPGYSAMVILELHSQSETDKHLPVVPFVKIFYRNKSETQPPIISIPGCENTEKMTCSLSQLKKILRPVTLPEEQFSSACTVTEGDKQYSFSTHDDLACRYISKEEPITVQKILRDISEYLYTLAF